MKYNKIKAAICALSAVVFLGAFVPTQQVFAEDDESTVRLTVDFDETSEQGGVVDEATELKVYALDEDTLNPLVGAKFQIINKSSGEVVVSWTTDEVSGGLIQITKQLAGGVHYILQEVEAPEGYAAAEDTEFYLTTGEDGTTSELTVVEGPATVRGRHGAGAQMQVTNVKKDKVIDRVVTQTTTNTTHVTRYVGEGGLAQTSDPSNVVAIVSLAIVGGVLVLGGLLQKALKH